jgi:hypothetical protein
MVHLRALVVLAALTLVPISAAATRASDQGRDRPPAVLKEEFKTIWMTEWVACNRIKMGTLASQIHMKIPAGRSPQVSAIVLAKRAMLFLYDTDPEIKTAVDGCRNGILWRYYHPG